MPYTPPPPGSPLTPGWFTRAWRALVARTQLYGGNGIQVRPMPEGGHLISLEASRLVAFPARITAAPDPATPHDPAGLVYTAQAIGRPQLVLTGVKPKYGRPTRNDEWMLWPAIVGDYCEIVRERDGSGTATDVLRVTTEAIARGSCP